MENDESKRLMSREEQLQQTAEEWADYYKHAEDLCDYISIRVAYKEGAAWADKHPDISALWHPASEEPQGNNWKILCQDEENVSPFCRLIMFWIARPLDCLFPSGNSYTFNQYRRPISVKNIIVECIEAW